MANEHRSGPIPYKHACGVPGTHCTGDRINVSAGLTGTSQCRAHASPEEAFRCRTSWLVATGYTRVGSRAFAPPDGGPVLVLTKPCRFGNRLRGGKGSRWMSNVKIRGGGLRSGTVSTY
jgi:hypothetical protein